jgi:hypothetical protein
VNVAKAGGILPELEVPRPRSFNGKADIPAEVRRAWTHSARGQLFAHWVYLVRLEMSFTSEALRGVRNQLDAFRAVGQQLGVFWKRARSRRQKPLRGRAGKQATTRTGGSHGDPGVPDSAPEYEVHRGAK